MDKEKEFMRRAIELSFEKQDTNHGGPFGCVVVRDNQIIGEGWNHVTSENDPTAHGEIVAIRNACKNIGDFSLKGCTLYTSSEPCPMCLSAIYWARIETVFYGNSIDDALGIGFDDSVIYKELELPINSRSIKMIQLLQNESIKAFEKWASKSDKTMY